MERGRAGRPARTFPPPPRATLKTVSHSDTLYHYVIHMRVTAGSARVARDRHRPRATATSVAIARCTATESFCTENAVHERAAHAVYSTVGDLQCR